MTSVYEVRGCCSWLVERETCYRPWTGHLPREPRIEVETITNGFTYAGSRPTAVVVGHRVKLDEFTEDEEREVMPLIQEALTNGDVSLIKAYIKFITRQGNSDNDQAQ